MSEPKRYDVGMTEETNSRTGFYASFPRVYEAEQGKYVEYEDYARLKAEVDAWKDMVADSGVACNERARENQDLENQIERLKAEVERLTAFTTRTIIPNEELQAENARLKAKVEKLECDAETSYRESMNDEYDLDWLNKINNGLMKEKEKLQAQVERLTKQNALATPRSLIASQDIKTLREQIGELKLENSQYEEHHKYGQNVITSLREEVENSKRINTDLLVLSNRQANDIRRLTKAGDDVANFLGPCYAVREWNAAKEGKQS